MDKLENRTYKLEIFRYNENNEKVVLGTFGDDDKSGELNVKFNFQKHIGNTLYGTGKVSICGLNTDIVKTLTTIGSVDSAIKERKQIKLYAGYGENKALIIDGTITSALPTIPPNIWINCDVINGYERKLEVKSVSVKANMNLEELSKTVADQIGVKLDFRIKKKSYLSRKMQNFSKNCSLEYLLAGIMEMYPYNPEEDVYGYPVAYIDNDTLIVDYSNFGQVDIEEENRKIYDINKFTGMVGLPELADAGTIASITTLLRPEIKAGDVINLKSEMIPSANGYYNVIGTTYIGEYRGTQWYSQFYCRRLYK